MGNMVLICHQILRIIKRKKEIYGYDLGEFNKLSFKIF